MQSKDRYLKRSSGILMPIFALPSPYGIGALGKAARDFVDFLADAGQSWWQILPVGSTGFGDSPYQSPSSYAGNPYFIDLDLLKEDGQSRLQSALSKPLSLVEKGYGARLGTGSAGSFRIYSRKHHLASGLRAVYGPEKAFSNGQLAGLAGQKRPSAQRRHAE